MDVVVSCVCWGRTTSARRLVVLVIAAAAALVAIGAPVAVAGPPAAAGGMVHVFGEDFTGTSLNTSVWEPGWNQDANITGPMSERCLSKGNVSVSSGFLRLTMTKLRAGQTQTCSDGQHSSTVSWLGGLVDSKPRANHPGFKYSYGYVEWRARTSVRVGTLCEQAPAPCIAGLPQLWSISDVSDFEIDTFEGEHGKASYNLHPPTPNGASYQPPGAFADAQWHTFASLWTPSGIDYYYDGTYVGHRSGDGTAQYLVMDIIEGAPQVNGATLDVDSVDVWQPLPPSATTTAASTVLASQATLTGTVNPRGQPTTYQFEYGTSTSYGAFAPASLGAAGSADTATPLSVTVDALQSSTTYHYRIVATNMAGTTYGSDQSFTTPGHGASVLGPDGRQHHYYKGANGHLWEWTYPAGGGTPAHTDRNAEIAGSPTAFTVGQSVVVFFRNGDSKLAQLEDNGTSANLYTYNKTITSDPSGYALSGARQAVFFRDADGQLGEWFYANGTITYYTWGESLAGAPLALAINPSSNDRQAVFYRGVDGHLHQWYHDGSAHTYDWSTMLAGGLSPNAKVTGDLAGYVLADGRQAVFYRGANGELWQWYHDLSDGHFYDWGGDVRGTPAAYRLADGQQAVFFRGAAEHLWEWTHDGTAQHFYDWNGMIPFGAQPLTGDPSAFAFSDGRQVAFVRDADGGLREWYYDGAVHWYGWGGSIAP